MKVIHDLDFSTMESIIRWIDKHATDEMANIGVTGEEAVEIFEVHGYARYFVPPNRDRNNSDEFGRWIIAQALEFLARHSSIRGLVKKYTGMWLEQFGKQPE